MTISSRILLLLSLSLPLGSNAGALAAPSMPNGAELQLLVEKLRFLGSVLYVAAHPDDENTALLAYLAQGRLARTAYLSITRGDGGQNLIGTEQGAELGVVRTQELLEARRRDGAEQLFTRAIDFGYTKSVEETLRLWGKEEVLSDVVRVIRRFQPDVIITRFPGDGRGRHGQHTASAVLAQEAFAAAADPQRFPEQLGESQGLEPWQARRLLWDASPFFGGGEDPGEELALDLGEYSPLLGRSFTEIAAISRSMHKSQGFGSSGSRGSRFNRLEHRLGQRAHDDLFDGVETGWGRVAGADEVGRLLAAAAAELDPGSPAEIVPLLVEAFRELQQLEASPWVRHKGEQLREAIRAACGLWLEAIAERPWGVPGESLPVDLAAVNRSPVTVRLLGIELPFAAPAQTVGDALARNQVWSRELALEIPADQPTTGPYWLTQPPDGARYRVSDTAWIGLPERPPLPARFEVEVAGTRIDYRVPVLYRWSDRVEGEQYRSFEVVPRLSLSLEEQVLVFADESRREVVVSLRNHGREGSPPAAGELRLRIPPGWRVDPPEHRFELAAGSQQRLTFRIDPPSAPSTGDLVAEARLDGAKRLYSRGLHAIEYQHIPIQTLLPAARARVARLQLAKRGERIGYVMGAGDEVPAALRQVGYEVVLLDDQDLATGDLASFDAVVLGVRAFNTRPAVLEHQPRLLAYVEAGGTLVVQYNTASRRGGGLEGIGPYPFRISRDRVSVEDAPVVLLDPEHPLLTTPNRIVAQDFEGWVQERGLYFAGDWDPRYQPLLSSHDPGESEKRGGLLYATYGRGVFIYTGYSFFRELPAGVAGAYRLFVNLISARQ